MASAPSACSRQLGTVASSVASALHASQPGMFAVSIACRNFSITGLSVIAASLASRPSCPPRLAASLQPYHAGVITRLVSDGPQTVRADTCGTCWRSTANRAALTGRGQLAAAGRLGQAAGFLQAQAAGLRPAPAEGGAAPQGAGPARDHPRPPAREERRAD